MSSSVVSPETVPDAPRATGPALNALGAEADEQRRRDLRKMKALATGFLVFAAVVYLVMQYLDARPRETAAWVGYVRAAAEAGMVGALADWFAVTALFRHPLGLPIPHTALIKRKKDQIGDQLGGFIEENFMVPELIEQRATSLELPRRMSTWFADPVNAPRVSAEAARALNLAAEMLDDEDVERFLMAAVGWAAEPEWSQPVGRILEQLVDEDRLEPVLQLGADRAHEWALGSLGLIDRLIDRDGPQWMPKFAQNFVGDKIYKELVEFTGKVAGDPDHELRRAVIGAITQFADDLQNDPETIAKFEALKTELVGRDEVTGAASTAWKAGKAVIEKMLDDPNNTLRNTISSSVIQVAERIRDDEALQQKMNGWVARGAHHVASNYASEIISVITETVRGWDAQETSDKIELQVGRDLQFIRINGTVVGALAGLAIYTIAQLIFHH
ncbi:DUF445 family protein [Gordonia sp. X0973]|uniref:DUF445 domain-containing protein n=1 Tax=Gordonia sp. X0973 TaxID=2742602 RepID=UPI000F51DDB1|nr:DUF445 family protein [Gordonia sp. X0973]QKT06185.1 DUF445 family protein [Gordonia sp. X0973]